MACRKPAKVVGLATGVNSAIYPLRGIGVLNILRRQLAQFELDRCLDGKLARLRASQDAIDIGGRKPKLIPLLISVAQEAAKLGKKAEWIDSR